jgi:hypothetical protein
MMVKEQARNETAEQSWIVVVEAERQIVMKKRRCGIAVQARLWGNAHTAAKRRYFCNY